MLPINSVLRRAKKQDKYNVLDFVTHERYQSMLAKTGHNFYCVNPKAQGIKEFWNEKHGKVPDNYTILPRCEGDLQSIINSIPCYINIDFILSHQKFGQWQLAKPLSQIFHAPIISLEHTLPVPNWPEGQVDMLKQMSGDFNVFITKYNREKWKWADTEAEVLPHGVDTNLFTTGNEKRENHILTVANDYINRDWCLNYTLYKQVTQGMPTNPVGETPGLSKAPETLDDLIKEYQTSTIFLNTAHVSPIPCALLEAMACGCACVSVNACAVPEYIEHGVNGLLSNNPQELKLHLLSLLKDKKLRDKLGNNARKTILEKASLSKFVDNWNNLFERASNFVYKG